ncbi:MAG: TRAM domain-containing protein, partial [Flavobacteriaceae bacterium]
HIGKTEEVLIEGDSKKSADFFMGRNTQNAVVVFPKESYKVGDYVMVSIEDCTAATLKGKAVGYSKNN